MGTADRQIAKPVVIDRMSRMPFAGIWRAIQGVDVSPLHQRGDVTAPHWCTLTLEHLCEHYGPECHADVIHGHAGWIRSGWAHHP